MGIFDNLFKKEKGGDITLLLEETCAFLDKKQPTKGLIVSERVIDLDSRNATAWGYKGLALIQLKMFTESLSASEQALRFDPSLQWVWNNKGYALLCLGRDKESIAALNQALMMDPEDTIAQQNRIQALHNIGDGYGELTVTNGSGYDAILFLTRLGLNTVFQKTRIRDGSSEKISGIPSGFFWLYFCFTQNGDTISRLKFSNSFDFTTERVWGELQYNRFSVTLHPVPSGTARTESVSEMEFPKG